MEKDREDDKWERDRWEKTWKDRDIRCSRWDWERKRCSLELWSWLVSLWSEQILFEVYPHNFWWRIIPDKTGARGKEKDKMRSSTRSRRRKRLRNAKEVCIYTVSHSAINIVKIAPFSRTDEDEEDRLELCTHWQ